MKWKEEHSTLRDIVFPIHYNRGEVEHFMAVKVELDKRAVTVYESATKRPVDLVEVDFAVQVTQHQFICVILI